MTTDEGARHRIPPFLPIYDRGATDAPPDLALPALARGGASWVQYRDKRADERSFYLGVTTALRAAEEHGLRLLVNDRVAVAVAAGAHGVHLGRDDLPAEAARRVLGSGAIVGLSIDDAEQARAARELSVDYVGLGPVFRTATKADAGAAVGLAAVAAVRQAVTIPLVAIGGISIERAAAVTAAGADSVAAVAALWSAPDPEVATRDFVAAAAAGLRRREAAGVPVLG